MAKKEEVTDPIEPLVDTPQSEAVPVPSTRDQAMREMFPPLNNYPHTKNGRGGHTGSPRNSWT